MSVLGLLNKTCTIRRPTATDNTVTGSTGYTYADAATNVPCAVQVSTATDGFTPVPTNETTYNVFFAYGADVTSNDRLTNITGLTNFSLAVTSEPIDDAGRGAYIRVTARHQLGEAGV